MECNNSIRDRGIKQQLLLGSEGYVRETLELEIIKLVVRFSIRFLKTSDRILRRT
jgi:hypothetical protein